MYVEIQRWRNFGGMCICICIVGISNDNVRRILSEESGLKNAYSISDFFIRLCNHGWNLDLPLYFRYQGTVSRIDYGNSVLIFSWNYLLWLFGKRKIINGEYYASFLQQLSDKIAENRCHLTNKSLLLH